MRQPCFEGDLDSNLSCQNFYNKVNYKKLGNPGLKRDLECSMGVCRRQALSRSNLKFVQNFMLFFQYMPGREFICR